MNALHQILFCNQRTTNGMRVACGTYGAEESYIQAFGGEI